MVGDKKERDLPGGRKEKEGRREEEGFPRDSIHHVTHSIFMGSHGYQRAIQAQLAIKDNLGAKLQELSVGIH